MTVPLLEIEDLAVRFDTEDGPVEAMDGLGLRLASGEILGLVGESGSGKSVTAYAVLGLVRPPGRILRGSIRFEGRDLLALPEAELRRVRGAGIGMVWQNPRTALNPVLTVGHQIARLLRHHRGLSSRAARERAVEMLRLVGIPEPGRRARQYAHQLSGGMCQRVMIAMALATQPRLLLADEPTTGLDVLVAARIMELLKDLGRQTGAAILLITHDLGTVAESCDRVAVMHAGQLVETAPVRTLFRDPVHPYTRALVAAIPRVDREVALEPIPGAVPSLLHAPPGCRYAARCALATERCRQERPPLLTIAPEHQVACFAAEPAA
jgi:oligopeptide/dipeptide ABC transporter ATP-binding protein